MHVTFWPSDATSWVSRLIFRSTYDRSQEVRLPPHCAPKSAEPYSETITPEVIPASVQTRPPLHAPVLQLAPLLSQPVRPQARTPFADDQRQFAHKT